MIAPPSEDDRYSIKIRVYLLESPEYLDIHVSVKNTVDEVIRHMMTLYSKTYPKKPLRYPNDPEAYELRLLDDDDEENFYKPFFEVSALERDEKIGDFQNLAFV